VKSIVIGSRGSDLALWQANHVCNRLENLGFQCNIKIIQTQGDRIQDIGFSKMEGKGFFTKEIEDALLKKEIDLAVHSHKDLETHQPAGLVIGAVSERAACEYVILIAKTAADSNLNLQFKQGAIVGTSSVRRKVQIQSMRPDAILTDLRGNVPPRIQKLRSGKYEAIVLAKAGLDRLELDLSEFHVFVCKPEQFIPAPAQGALALQCREEDKEMMQVLANLHDARTAQCISIERGVLMGLNGGCQLPLGVYANIEDNEFVVHVAFAKDDQSSVVFYSLRNESEKGAIQHVLKLLLEE